MGAYTFETLAEGPTVEEAFRTAVADAQYEHGHGGYSGTIAEKDGYVLVADEPRTYEAAHALADELIDADDPRVSDKWGPAGAIPLVGGGWLFFGWASS